MSNSNQVSSGGSRGTLSPESTTSSTSSQRTSSMPDISKHTKRMARLRDAAPHALHGHTRPSQASPPFTGASLPRMNRRLARLAPPNTPAYAPRVPSATNPTYYGADLKKYESRTRRYVDGKNASSRKSGPQVFSGGDGKKHMSRMMRLVERS